jgi:DNA-binding IclR family transcriptional regulator
MTIVSHYRSDTVLREEAILGCLTHVPSRPIDLARFLGRPIIEVTTCVRTLRERKLITRRDDGRYTLEVGEGEET